MCKQGIRDRDIYLLIIKKLAQGLAEPPIQLVSGDVSPWLSIQRVELTPPPSSAKVKNARSYTSNPPFVLKHGA
jgi:hypothetical protein